MAMNLSIKEVVVIAISLIMLVAGIFLVVRVAETKEVLSFPSPSERIIVGVEPESSQQGTLFLIKANYFEEKEQQDLRLSIEQGNYTELIELYDDGKHYDKEARDGIYVGFFDSKGRPLGKYEVKDKKEEIALASFVVHEQGCELIEGDNRNSNKINFVVLPSGYDDYEEFKEDAKKLLTGDNSLLNVEPFSSNKDKFSFSVVNTSRDLGCEKGCYNVTTLVCCDNKIIFEEASRCKYDSVLVLVRSKQLCGSASSYAKVCSKNRLSNLALIHEIGHSFADLADEYVYEDFYDYNIGEIDAVNCAEEGCEKWRDITEECYKGCTYSGLYRPAKKDSIMYMFVPVFNSVSEKHIENLIENYIASGKATEKALPEEKSYFINLDYNEGKISIGEIFLKPIKLGVELKKSSYKAEIVSKDKSLFKTSFYVPNKIFPLPNSTAMIIQEKFNFPLLLPYFPNADNLLIYKDNEKIAETSLALFSKTCGNGICEETENHLSCADCAVKDNFCETSVCDPDCESQKNCERNRKIIYFISISLILGALILMFIIFCASRLRKNRE